MSSDVDGPPVLVPLCLVTDTTGFYQCSLNLGHDGDHRAHVSDDLTRAYVIIRDGVAL